MKTKKNRITENDHVYSLLKEYLGNRTDKAVARLAVLRIETVGQFCGALHAISLPDSEREAKRKGYTASVSSVKKNRSKSQIIQRIQRVLGIPEEDAVKIFSASQKVVSAYQNYHFAFSGALGSKKGKKINGNGFWDNNPKIKIVDGFFVVPDYEKAGPVYDQGNRGTCVANAGCSMLDYKLDTDEWSRQMLYHQCKMIDDIPDEEGTYIETAMEVLSNTSITDIGNVPERKWPYNPNSKATTHQGPPPERAFNCIRIIADEGMIAVRDSKKVDDIKYLLSYSCPVVIGAALYESFFGRSTTHSGWVTLPLPGEMHVGNHAMLIVGYDDARRIFLVRNSWGPDWAHANDMGYAGHAWIPYEYINKYCHSAYTIPSLIEEKMIVAEEDRLYNNVLVSQYPGKIAAMSRKAIKRRRSKSSRRVNLWGWLIRAAIVILLWNAYKEPIIKITTDIVSTINNKAVPRIQKTFTNLKNP